jgi:hypothetical protein
MKNRYVTRQAETAVVHGDGTRHCAWCGDHIDPIDWCGNCTADAPCGTNGGPHRRLRKRADAAFCDSGCRTAYQRDTGPQLLSRRYR